MNSLSWLLYAAEVAEGLKTTAAVVAGVGIVGISVGLFFALISRFDEYGDGGEFGAAYFKVLPKLGMAVGLILVCALIIPSRQTLMLIAASEVGETVLASKEAQQIGGEAGQLATDSLRLLRKYVSEQLAEAGK